MKISRSSIDPVLLSSIGMLFPIWTVIWLTINWSWTTFLVVLLTSWFMGIHITMFAHRAWCHRAWKPSSVVDWYGLIVFSLCLVGNSIGWVGIHREHHAHCDTDRDPHSPYHKSRWAIQFLSYFNQVKTKYIVDLGRDSRHLWFYHRYWAINLIWFAVLCVIDPALLGFWIAIIGITVFKLHTINSLCHRTP
jgi:fatty-acid desaturase